MKFAVLSDIHGNHYALEKVLESVSKLGISRLLILGDIVGYYYDTHECLKLLNFFEWKSIQGNHEYMLKSSLNSIDQRLNYFRRYGSSLNFAMNNLNQKQINLLINLPETINIHRGKVGIKLCHGSPWDRDQYIYQNSEKKLLNRAIDTPFDYVFIGHNHYQFLYQKNGKYLVSPGSVGQNRKTGGVAQWAVFDYKNLSLELMSTPYSTDELIKRVGIIDPHIPYLSTVLLRNLN